MTVYTLMNQSYTHQNGTNYVHYFARDEHQNWHHFSMRGGDPYFYIEVPSDERLEWARSLKDQKLFESHVRYDSTQDRMFVKVDKKLEPGYYKPGKTIEFRKEYASRGYVHYEANIEYPYRQMIDRGLYDLFTLDENNKMTTYRPWSLPQSKYQIGHLPRERPNQLGPNEAPKILVRQRKLYFDIEVNSADKYLWDYCLRHKIFRTDTNLPCDPEKGTPITNRTDIGTAFPAWQRPCHPIIMLQTADSYTDDVNIFFLLPPDAPADAHDLIRQHILDNLSHNYGITHVNVIVRLFTDEREMLEAFAKWTDEIKFDVYTGWNTNFFDLPYLVARAQWLSADITPLSPLRYVNLREDELSDEKMTGGKGGQVNASQPVTVGGVSNFDMYMAFIKFTYLNKESSYSLKAIVPKYLSLTYDDLGAAMPAYWNASGLLDICFYGAMDAIVLKLLDDRFKLIDNYDNIRRVAGVSLNDALANSKIIKVLRVRLGRYLDRLPLRTESLWTPQDPKITGGFVIKPLWGLQDDIITIDVAALYPNAIRHNNLGFSTLVDKTEAERRGIPYHTVRYIETDKYGQSHEVETCFRTDFESLYSIMSAIFSDGREIERGLKKQASLAGDHVMEKFHKDREKAFKLILVSIYGAMVYRWFPEYNYKVGSSITGVGRAEMHAMMDYFRNECGAEVVYGDTDSVFVRMANLVHMRDGKVTRQTINDCMKIEASTNKWLERRAKKMGALAPLVIKVEKIVKRALFKRSDYPSEKQRQQYEFYSARLEFLRCQADAGNSRAEAEANRIERLFELPLKDGGVWSPHGLKKQYVLWVVAVEGQDQHGQNILVPCDKIVSMGIQTKRKDTPRFVNETLTQFFDIILKGGREKAKQYVAKRMKELRSLPLMDIALTKGFNKLPKYYTVQNVYTQGATYAERYFHQQVDLAVKAKLVYIKQRSSKSKEFPPHVTSITTSAFYRLSPKRRKKYVLKGVVTLTGSFDDIPDAFWRYFKVDWAAQEERLLKPIRHILESVGIDFRSMVTGQTKLAGFLT